MNFGIHIASVVTAALTVVGVAAAEIGFDGSAQTNVRSETEIAAQHSNEADLSFGAEVATDAVAEAETRLSSAAETAVGAAIDAASELRGRVASAVEASAQTSGRLATELGGAAELDADVTSPVHGSIGIESTGTIDADVSVGADVIGSTTTGGQVSAGANLGSSTTVTVDDTVLSGSGSLLAELEGALGIGVR